MGQPQQRKVHLFKDLAEDSGNKAEERGIKVNRDGQRPVVKVPSLLFDIELEDSVPEESEANEELLSTLRQLKALTQARTSVELQLQQQVRLALTEADNEGYKLDAHRLAKKLDVPGYTFRVRTALGGGWSGDCLRQLRHFFLTCIVSGTTGPVRYVIDPSFREQFEIANPTAQYSTILAELPKEFIGTEEKISALVTLLSNEISRSFQATGATLPPWRHPASILSKWRPRRSEDIAVTPSKDVSKSSQHSLSGYDAKDEKDGSVKINLCANASPNAVAMTIAETGGSRKLGVPAATKPQNCPLSISNSGKRVREQPSSAKYSSLLAAKLRGVSACAPNSGFSGFYSNKSQA